MNLIVFHFEEKDKVLHLTYSFQHAEWGEGREQRNNKKDEILSQTTERLIFHCRIECYVELVISFYMIK